ncbi:hypothetical protein HMPREF3214_00403 [Alloscardovia omnicolens]|nr:hypothetical protein HMPREF3214_00403 [Alloscardovia omnicolens]
MYVVLLNLARGHGFSANHTCVWHVMSVVPLWGMRFCMLPDMTC